MSKIEKGIKVDPRFAQFNKSFCVNNRSCPNSPAIKKSYRLVVVGSPHTGKTSIVNRFLNDRFEERYIPTIENFHRKLYEGRGETHQLKILQAIILFLHPEKFLMFQVCR